MTNENLPLPMNQSLNLQEISNRILPQRNQSESDMNHLDGSMTSSTSSLLSQYGTPPTDHIPQTTNTVEAALSLLGNNQNHEFNQLFNFVNYIDQIEIIPGQISRIIIAFLPEERENIALESIDPDGMVSKSESFLGNSESAEVVSDETFDYTEINGVLFFLCFKDLSKLGTTTASSNAISSSDFKRKYSKQKMDSKIIDSTESYIVPSLSSAPDYQTTCKFRSRVCKSVLTTDISSTGLIFDDCIAGGGTYFKDFTVNNRSEIELFWILNTVDLSNQKDQKNVLKFTDYDTGETLDFSPISAYSPKRIRVSFKPTEIGEFNYDLQIENQNDSRNTIQTRIHAIVRSVHREEKLIITTGNMLNFGDCVAGVWKKKFISLRNVSDTPIEVSFTSDNPTEIVFQLRSDDQMVPIGDPPGRRKRTASGRTADHSQKNLLVDEQKKNHFDEHIQHNLPRTHSEISITRSRSSSSSVDSDQLVLQEEVIDNVHDIVSITDQRIDFIIASNSRTDERDLYGSMDSQLRDNTLHRDEIARIEELVIRPGSEKIIDVCYLPGKDAITPDYRACRLTRRNFRLLLSHFIPGKQHEKEKNTIQCVARSCTSAIEVSPTILQFGDTDVGALKSSSIQIRNCSDLPTVVEMRFVSKILSATRGEIYIPAKQTIDTKIDIYPRKVNPDYRKEITVVNLLNSDNDQIVEVRSTNIDQQRVTFHSLFYHIITPQATHYLDFGTAVLNSSVVRTFSIENISSGELFLEITTSLPSELLVFTKIMDTKNETQGSSVVPLQGTRPSERKEKLLESIEVRRKFKRPSGVDSLVHRLLTTSSQKSSSLVGLNLSRSKRFLEVISQPNSTPMSPEVAISPDYLDLASTHKSIPDNRVAKRESLRKNVPYSEIESGLDRLPPALSSTDVDGSAVSFVEHEALDIDDLLLKLEKETGTQPPHFSKASLEEKYVKLHQALNRELTESIGLKQLIPCNQFKIAPQSHQTIILIMKCLPEQRMSDKSRKLDAKVYIKMLEFDKNVKHPQFEQLAKEGSIPIRELMVRAFLCKSSMELGQKHINFGTLDKTDRRTKKIVIRNKSEVALLYSILKSGSIASGDILFSEGQKGVVRGYAKKEVEFIFDPSLAGAFQEKLIIENVLDPSNDQHLIVKSNIRQQAAFNIETSELSFGACLIDQVCPVSQSIVISNPSSKNTRLIEIRVDPQDLKFNYCICEIWFSLEEHENKDDAPKLLLSKEMEEKIEQMEQKLKIAIRKGKVEKAEKLKDQLASMRAGKDSDFSKEKILPNESSAYDLSANHDLGGKEVLPVGSFKIKMGDNSIVIAIPPRSFKSVKIQFKAYRFPSTFRSNSFDARSSSFSTQSISHNSNTSVNTGSIDEKNIYGDFEICAIPILVHEQKNTDIIKKVIVNATVCFDQNTYVHHLEGIDYQRPSESSMVLDSTLLPLFQSPMGASEKIISEKPNLTVEVTLIDLGKLEVGEMKDCYFILTNPGESIATFKIETSDNELISFNEPMNGVLEPGESKKIDLQLYPKKHGRSIGFLSIISLEGDFCIPVRFLFYGVYSSYLNFTNVLSENAELLPSENRSYELDFQYCYVEATKRYAKVVSLQLENITTLPLVVNATSNLTQQCLIFRDETLESAINVEGLQLEPLEKTIVYIALQPGLVVNSARIAHNERPNENVQQADCRTLIGGIRFNVLFKDDDINPSIPSSVKLVQSPDGLYHIFTHTLKFNAIIGQSFLETSLETIDFGTRLEKNKVWESGFWIYNGTPKMPLVFMLESSTPYLTLSLCKGRVDPVDSNSPSSSEPEESGIWVSFTLKCLVSGFFDETIVCSNMNNSSQRKIVSVRAFMDPGSLKVSPANELLKWDNIFLSGSAAVSESVVFSFSIQKKLNDEVVTTLEYVLELQNLLDELVHLQAASNLLISVRWQISSGAGFIFHDSEAIANESTLNRSIQLVGSKLLLRPKQKAIAVISVPKPVMALDDQTASMALKGHKIGQKGVLLIRNMDSNTDLKLFGLSANYCISLGVIEPQILDLGKLGHFNYWQEVKFQVAVENVSEITLFYEIDLPDYISVVASNTGSEVGLKNRVISQSSQIVDFIFKPRFLEGTGKYGPQSTIIEFKNIYNPQNHMNLTLKYNLTQFELKFDRLQAGELILPPLIHPSPTNSLPCDNWISVTNISDHDVKFDIGCNSSPDVDSLVSLETLSRQSNSPATSFSLAPNNSFELKVRISALENSKLTVNTFKNYSYLINPDGITLGSLWFSVKSNKGLPESIDTNTQTRIESIPLRGVLIEGKTFQLSEKQLTFHSFPSSDSDNENHEVEAIPESEQKHCFSIINLSPVLSLSVNVAIEYPIEFVSSDSLFSISPLDKDMGAVISPGASLQLSVTLIKTDVSGVSEDIKIVITDSNSLTKKPQHVAIKIVEENTYHLKPFSKRDNEESPANIFEKINSSPTNDMLMDDIILPDKKLVSTKDLLIDSNEIISSETTPTSTFKNLIELKGCKKVFGPVVGDFEGFYELDLGQQDLSATSLVKKLTLECNGITGVPFRVYTSENDSNWLSLSRFDGVAELARGSASSTPANVITLTFNLSLRGAWCTYLVIENSENRLDTKFIRVSLEVVAKQNLKRAVTTVSNAAVDIPKLALESGRVFDVSTHALDIYENELNMGNLSFGTFYVARSLVIWNREIVPLEFSISSSLSREEDSEFIFSLSRTGPKLFTSVRIEPESHCQIFLRCIFNPTGKIEEIAREDYFETKTLEIFINCRLVKDYQKIINLKAFCYTPQMIFSETEFLFSGTFKDEKAQIKSANDVLLITNPSASPLFIQIMCDSLYFGLAPIEKNDSSVVWVASSFADRVIEIGPKLELKFRIVPLIENIERHLDQLKKVKYVQDHIVVYNKKKWHEKERIYVRLSFGYLKSFQFASDSLNHFLILESQCIRFLHQIAACPFGLMDISLVHEDTQFLYQYIIDELVHFGTREQAAPRYVRLAILLFKILFSKHTISPQSPLEKPSIQKQWIEPFLYFLSFYPTRNSRLDTLKQLAKHL